MNSVSFIFKCFLCLEYSCKIPTYQSLELDEMFNCTYHVLVGFIWLSLEKWIAFLIFLLSFLVFLKNIFTSSFQRKKLCQTLFQNWCANFSSSAGKLNIYLCKSVFSSVLWLSQRTNCKIQFYLLPPHPFLNVISFISL